MNKSYQIKSGTVKCHLTFFCFEDIPTLLKMQSDPEFARLRQATGLASSENDVLNWLTNVSKVQGKSRVTMAIRDSLGGTLFGYISVETKNSEPQKGVLGVFLGPQSKSGSGSKALQEMEKIANEVMMLDIIEVHVLSANTKAINFFTKNQYRLISATKMEKIFQKELNYS